MSPSDMTPELQKVLAEIGTTLSDDFLGAKKPTLEELIMIGFRWCDSMKTQLCSAICQNDRIKRALAEPQHAADIVALITDILEHHAVQIMPIPPATAALVFVRIGYGKLC